MQRSPLPYNAIVNTPIGKVGIKTQNQQLRHIDFVNDHSLIKIKDSFTQLIVDQLQAYFADPNFTFDLPYEISGSSFQEKVWQALTKIPSGSALSYGDLAKKLHSSPRAIGGGCRTNPLPIIIPCHRIVSKEGLGGFSGATDGHPLQIKTWLLRHEGYLS